VGVWVNAVNVRSGLVGVYTVVGIIVGRIWAAANQLIAVGAEPGGIVSRRVWITVVAVAIVCIEGVRVRVITVGIAKIQEWVKRRKHQEFNGAAVSVVMAMVPEPMLPTRVTDMRATRHRTVDFPATLGMSRASVGHMAPSLCVALSG
jgi:hypothetical protein